MAVAGPWSDADVRFREHLDRQRRDAGVEFDAVVVGTGFGGAVTACRLVEAGFNVCILERGRRYGAEDFPKYPVEDLFASGDETDASARPFAPPPDFSRWLWSQDHGLYEIRDLGDGTVVQAAGYGGGSLIYANVHLRPPYGVFDEWPAVYSGTNLAQYFDLAAYMLGATPVPQRLAKTLQLQRAAAPHPGSFFRTPLAVNFTEPGSNRHGRHQNACDMRARCWRGCDHQAKNTLDLNYLAIAEDLGCTILTMAEVTKVSRRDGAFSVEYADRLRREPPAGQSGTAGETRSVTACTVFLCAGAVNTTELLYRSQETLGDSSTWRTALGSRYSPNADSLSAVFDCDEPHEADYGPTVTAAVLYDQAAQRGEFSCSIEFDRGARTDRTENGRDPVAGMTVTSRSTGTAILAHLPIVDHGQWTTGDATGTLVLTNITAEDQFTKGDTLTCLANGDVVATVRAGSGIRRQREWFLVQDGGYPTDIEPLISVFRSSLWLRRNRYLETPRGESPSYRRAAGHTTPLRRPPTGRLRVGAFVDSLGGTSAAALRGESISMRNFAPDRGMAEFAAGGPVRELLLPGLLSEPLEKFFPPFLVQALRNDRAQLLAQAAAVAIPLLGRILDDLSATVAAKIDPETREKFSKQQVEDRQLEVLVRGIVRQLLQILAGTEVALAANAAQVLLNPLPEKPADVVNLVGAALLWAMGYNENVGHTAVLLTMGRDNYRGRLEWNKGALTAALPARALDTTNATHERVLREIAMEWRGELRTNPGWTTLGRRVSVHSQGGCPMGEHGSSVTTPEGRVHGCEGLFVMDGAAFPTSVGVNPSATIAAVAEYKVEHFIREERKQWRQHDREWRGHDREWRARHHDQVAEWISRNGGAAAIDPLNATDASTATTVTSRAVPSREVDVLGLVFAEEMHGFCSEVDRDSYAKLDPAFHRLSQFPTDLRPFLHSEDKAISDGLDPLSLRLCVKAPDLARVVAAGRDLNPARLLLSGKVVIKGQSFTIDREHSFFEMFLRSDSANDGRRFFRYHVQYGEGQYVLDGVKVLADEPGFDAWHDTATLYVQLTSPAQCHRGVLRLSIEQFVRAQMPSMRITGTRDAARQSWALIAFYKYFAGELADIYMKRAEAVKDALFKLMTSIHV